MTSLENGRSAKSRRLYTQGAIAAGILVLSALGGLAGDMHGDASFVAVDFPDADGFPKDSLIPTAQKISAELHRPCDAWHAFAWSAPTVPLTSQMADMRHTYHQMQDLTNRSRSAASEHARVFSADATISGKQAHLTLVWTETPRAVSICGNAAALELDVAIPVNQSSPIRIASISGVGATSPILSKWAGAFRGVTGSGLNYQAIGSGGQIAQIKAKNVTFGASDKPLGPHDLDAAGLVQFPTVISGEVLIYNVPGIASDQLVFDGPTIAEIYLGKITRWNDARIKALNPTLDLPDLPVTIVHRSDGSGATYIFTVYLSRVSTEWANSIGAEASVDWPLGIGAKGNEGVAGTVLGQAGAIGYVEYPYAKENHLQFSPMINQNGKTVTASLETFQAAASNTDWNAAREQGFSVILANQPGDDSWPITMTTYILMHKNPADPAASAEVLKFFKWAFENGDTMATGLGYAPMPPNAVQAVEESWKGIDAAHF